MTRPDFLAAHAAHPEWPVALAECLAQLRHRAAGCTLGWCYFTDYYASSADALLAELRRALPGVAWVGTVGIGVAASGVEYFDEPALVLMLAPLPRESFRLFSGRQPLPGPGAAAGSDFQAHTAQVHAEGSTPEVQGLIGELAERTATGYLFGGLASSRTRSLHIADEVLTGGLSGVLFGPQVDLLSRVTQGCQPIGPRRTVTRAQANYLLALDGRPALDCVLADLGLEPDLPVEELGEALSATLVGMSSGADDLSAGPGQFGPDTLVRHIVGVDPRARVLAIGDEVAPDSLLAFCTRHPDAALADVRRIATAIRDEAESSGRAMSGALYVSCSGRGGPHFGAPHAELQAVRHALGEVPLAGFFAGGEIARDHLYGYTAVLTVFTARPD